MNSIETGNDVTEQRFPTIGSRERKREREREREHKFGRKKRTYFRKKECARFPLWRRCSVRRGKQPEVRRRSLNAGLGLTRGHPLILLYDLWPSGDEIHRRWTMLASSSRSRFACLCIFHFYIYVCIYIYTYVCIYICIYIYTRYIQIHGQVYLNYIILYRTC